MPDTKSHRGRPSVMVDGEAIRAWRIERGLSQEKLASLSDVTRRTIQRAEAGEPVSLETLNFIADALDVPASKLRKASSVSDSQGKDYNDEVQEDRRPEAQTGGTSGDKAVRKIAAYAVLVFALYFIDGFLADGYVNTVKQGSWRQSAFDVFESNRDIKPDLGLFSVSEYRSCVERRMKIETGFGIIYIFRQQALNNYGGNVARNCGYEQAGYTG